MADSHQGPGFHPLYLQVKERLIQRVVSGDWKPGEALPSEMKLAGEYQVSQGTVRKALEEMEAEHLVVRHQGKGTFVSARETETPLHFFAIVDRHDRPVAIGKPLAFDYSSGEATERERRELDLAPGERVYRIYRVRPLNGAPALIEDIVMSESRFLGLPEFLRDSERMNSYLVMEREFGVLVVRAEEWVDAVSASAQEAKDVGLEEGAPMLRILRIAYGLDGRPAERRVMRFATDGLRYRNQRR